MNFVEFSKIADHAIIWALLIANLLIAIIASQIVRRSAPLRSYGLFAMSGALLLSVGLLCQIIFVFNDLVGFSASQWRIVFILKVITQFGGAMLSVFAVLCVLLKSREAHNL